MKPFTLVLIAICAITALILGLAVMQSGPEKKAMPLTIKADRNVYTVVMSSTVGIGLTPAYPDTIDNSTVMFRWHTDYGRFLSWTDSRVNELGMDVTTGDGKIYWSYLPEDGKAKRPPVHISLAMIDKASGAALDNASLEIGWGEWDTAVVKA